MLSALAQATHRIRIGSMVNGMHYRHPAVTANAAATLDIISGGRLDLGLGAGWFEPESQAYGIPLGTLKERMDQFEEGTEVIVRLLTQEHTDFHGKHYDLTNARCEPKAVQIPHPPIAIGGKGRKRTLRIAAKYAQLWDAMFSESTDEFIELSAVLDEHCVKVGRDPKEITRSMHVSWPVDADPKALADRAAEFVAAGATQIVFSMRGPYRADLLGRWRTPSAPPSPKATTSPYAIVPHSFGACAIARHQLPRLSGGSGNNCFLGCISRCKSRVTDQRLRCGCIRLPEQFCIPDGESENWTVIHEPSIATAVLVSHTAVDDASHGR